MRKFNLLKVKIVYDFLTKNHLKLKYKNVKLTLMRQVQVFVAIPWCRLWHALYFVDFETNDKSLHLKNDSERISIFVKRFKLRTSIRVY